MIEKENFNNFTMHGGNMRMIHIPCYDGLGHAILIILNKEEKLDSCFENRIPYKCIKIFNDPSTIVIRTISELYDKLDQTYKYFCDIIQILKRSGCLAVYIETDKAVLL